MGMVLDRVASRAPFTRRGDGGIIEAGVVYVCETSRTHSTVAVAKTYEQQLRELVWYSRHAGGVYVDSDEFAADDGLYRLDSVDSDSDPYAQTTGLLRLTLTLTRIGGGAANVTRWLHVQPTLQSNSWGVTSTPWYARPVGASNLGPVGDSLSRTSADGTITAHQSSSINRYRLNTADYNAGECKVWDTGGSADTATWTRVYGPDHQFASPDYCAIDNALIRFNPVAASPGEMDFYIYEASGGAWREVGTRTYARVASGTALAAWQAVQITELTPWRVTVQWRCSVNVSPFWVVETLTLERGRPVALYDLSVSSAVEMRVGLFGAANSRFTFGHNSGSGSTDNLADAYDSDTDTGFNTIDDADDNWLGLVGDTADHDVMAIVAARTATNSALTTVTGGGAYVSQTGATTLAVYIGGIAYDTANVVAEAEAGSLGGTAATATVSGASGGTPNCVSLPTNTAAVTTLNAGTMPALSGTANIIVRMYARIQNVGTSASDEAQIRLYNETAANYPANTTKTFDVLGSTGTWKWISVEWTGWNGTDTLRAEVRRSVAGGGGTLYADLVLMVTLDSATNGIRAVARAALTENKVWPENSRMSV